MLSPRGIGSFGVSSVVPRAGRRAEPAAGMSTGGGLAVVESGWVIAPPPRSAGGLLDERGVDRAAGIRHGLRLAEVLPELARLLEDVVDRARAILRPVVGLRLLHAPD